MKTITSAYTESGVDYTQSFDVLSTRGLDDVDQVNFIGTSHSYLNGSREEQIAGFQRVATIDFGVVNSFADRTFLYNFVRNNTRQIRYNGDVLFASLGGVEATVGGAVLTPQELVNEWLFGYQNAQRFVLTLIEAYVHRAWGVVPVAESLMYLKRKVTIAGTVDSPETLTTNVDKLATMETGAVWPTFNDSTHVYHVEINGAPYQDRSVFLANTPTVSGGNITFQVAASDAGALQATCYADIVIFLQAK